MANPSGTHHQEAASYASATSFNGANPSNGISGRESLSSGLQHNSGISMDWTVEEQAILEEGLAKYAEEKRVDAFAKIAMEIPNKTIRDLALRTRWMTERAISKRRKEDNISRKPKDIKERYTEPSNFIAGSDAPRAATSMMPMDYDEGMPYEDFGVTGELLKQNRQVFSQISANLSTFQIHDNLQLLYQTRDNILNIMNNLNDGPDVMKQMPPLPVRLNEELANTVLPHPNFVMK